MDIDKIYNYYLYNIYTILNENLGFLWYFEKISNKKEVVYGRNPENDIQNSLQNAYLKDNTDHYEKLVNSVLSNGLYFPFYGKLSEDDNHYKILLGNHKHYGLRRYDKDIKKIDKEFLFIDFPNINQRLPYPIELYHFEKFREEYRIYYKKIQYYVEILSCLDIFGETMSEILYSLEKDGEIRCCPILNIERLFRYFLNNPFTLLDRS